MSPSDKTTSSAEELSRKGCKSSFQQGFARLDQCQINTFESAGLAALVRILASVLFYRLSTASQLESLHNDCSCSFNPSVTLSHRLHALEDMIPERSKKPAPQGSG
ncbi:hypothetical protein BC830DRAFT_1167035 [Chytriomyces sp. MP71]|nr:hypothetical protein BC830DRAFT_1167035 [Chytriomyces sp. MP71]